MNQMDTYVKNSKMLPSCGVCNKNVNTLLVGGFCMFCCRSQNINNDHHHVILAKIEKKYKSCLQK